MCYVYHYYSILLKQSRLKYFYNPMHMMSFVQIKMEKLFFFPGRTQVLGGTSTGGLSFPPGSLGDRQQGLHRAVPGPGDDGNSAVELPEAGGPEAA